MAARRVYLSAVALLAAAACRTAPAPALARTAPPKPSQVSANSETAEASPSTGLADRAARTEPQGKLTHLQTPAAPMLWIPRDRPERLPLVVVAHGAGGSPKYHCEFWSQVVRSDAFVLCLRGKSMGAGSHYFPNHHALAELLREALLKLSSEYGGRIRPLGNVFVGYSQGATMGSLIAREFAEALPHLVYLEGGYRYWNVAAAQGFNAAGGVSLFFSCGTNSCSRGVKKVTPWLARARLQTQLSESDAGHTPAAEVGQAAAEHLLRLLSEPTQL